MRSVGEVSVGLLEKRLPARHVGSGLKNEEHPIGASPWCLERGDPARTRSEVGAPTTVPNHRVTMEEAMQVIIGIDSHKATHTAVAVSSDAGELAHATRCRTARSTRAGRTTLPSGRGRSCSQRGARGIR